MLLHQTLKPDALVTARALEGLLGIVQFVLIEFQQSLGLV
jgi:hypothetical protein